MNLQKQIKYNCHNYNETFTIPNFEFVKLRSIIMSCTHEFTKRLYCIFLCNRSSFCTKVTIKKARFFIAVNNELRLISFSNHATKSQIKHNYHNDNETFSPKLWKLLICNKFMKLRSIIMSRTHEFTVTLCQSNASLTKHLFAKLSHCIIKTPRICLSPV